MSDPTTRRLRLGCGVMIVMFAISLNMNLIINWLNLREPLRAWMFGLEFTVKDSLTPAESTELARCLGVQLPRGVDFDLATMDHGMDVVFTARARLTPEQAEEMKKSLDKVAKLGCPEIDADSRKLLGPGWEIPSSKCDVSMYSGVLVGTAPPWHEGIGRIVRVYEMGNGTQVAFCRMSSAEYSVYVEGYHVGGGPEMDDLAASGAARIFAKKNR